MSWKDRQMQRTAWMYTYPRKARASISHLWVEKRDKLAQTSLCQGAVYHNNIPPFFSLSLSMSLRSPGSLWWCLPFDVVPLLWRRSRDFSFPAGASDSVCVEESSSWDSSSLWRKLGKKQMRRAGKKRGVSCRERCKFSRGIRVGDDFENTLNGSRKGLFLVVRMAANLLKAEIYFEMTRNCALKRRVVEA